jgi:hypothetical protein
MLHFFYEEKFYLIKEMKSIRVFYISMYVTLIISRVINV